jgi:molecular chaperone GrpE
MTNPDDRFPDAPLAEDDAPAQAAADGAGSGTEDMDGATPGLTALQRVLQEQQDRYLRLAAEYDNFRKRTIRERQEAEARGQADLVRGLLEALDDLTRFAHVDPDAVDARTVVEGTAMVERKLLKALSSRGLEIVDPTGQPFSPERHEAVSTVPAASPAEDHLVAQTYQPGYVFNGQLLRPARVVVKQWNG